MHTPVHIYNCIKPCKIKCRDTIAHDFLCNTVRMCRGQYDIGTLSARRSALLWVATENGEQLFLKALEEGERGTAYVGVPGQQNCIWGGKCGRQGVVQTVRIRHRKSVLGKGWKLSAKNLLYHQLYTNEHSWTGRSLVIRRLTLWQHRLYGKGRTEGQRAWW